MERREYIGPVELRNFGVDWTMEYLARLERQGRFPRRVRWGVRTVRWRLAEVEAWLAAREAESVAPPAA
jgi:hypothetical protein